uniref:Uncharacterized protein MANES_13G077400 n=1 Tax=Rhizophora mucronata TaxID=61149 RepID=A0A2P2MKE3_RHIMU
MWQPNVDLQSAILQNPTRESTRYKFRKTLLPVNVQIKISLLLYNNNNVQCLLCQPVGFFSLVLLLKGDNKEKWREAFWGVLPAGGVSS